MCGYCARELNPALIEKLKTELPDNVPPNGDADLPGNAALVNSDAAVASGELQLQDVEVSFRPAESAFSANAWSGDDTFVFTASLPDTGNGAMASWVGTGLSNLMEQKGPSMSLKTTNTTETVFWTYDNDLSLDDWHF